MAAFCLSRVKCAGDQGQHAAGLQCVNRLGEEVIVQGQLLPVVLELHVGEGHVADHRVDAVSGRRVSRKFSMRMSWPGWSARAMRPEMVSSSTPMKRIPCGARYRKLPGAAARLQHGGVVGDAEAGQRLVHGADDGRGGVEGVEGGALGAVVFLGREQRSSAPRPGPASRHPCSGR